MACIMAAKAQDKRVLLVIWSNLIERELDHIMELNPNLEDYKIIDYNPSEDDCKFIYEKYKETYTYRLPKIYTQTRVKKEREK